MNAPNGHSQVDHEQLVEQLEAALRLARGARKPNLQVVPDASEDTVALAKRIFKARRRREASLSALGFEFGEPAWDILLDLYISAHEGRRIAVSSACVAANVPATTALRWIAALTERGLILREDDPADKRRAHIRLAPNAMLVMERYLSLELADRAFV